MNRGSRVVSLHTHQGIKDCEQFRVCGAGGWRTLWISAFASCCFFWSFSFACFWLAWRGLGRLVCAWSCARCPVASGELRVVTERQNTEHVARADQHRHSTLAYTPLQHTKDKSARAQR